VNVPKLSEDEKKFIMGNFKNFKSFSIFMKVTTNFSNILLVGQVFQQQQQKTQKNLLLIKHFIKFLVNVFIIKLINFPKYFLLN
jgi:hypothetical protein